MEWREESGVSREWYMGPHPYLRAHKPGRPVREVTFFSGIDFHQLQAETEILYAYSKAQLRADTNGKQWIRIERCKWLTQ